MKPVGILYELLIDILGLGSVVGTRVMALGGSLLSGNSDEIHDWIMGLALILERRDSEGSATAIVVGGGSTARRAIEAASTLTSDRDALDRIGIAATRLNASLIREGLSGVGIRVSEVSPFSIEEAVSSAGKGVIVMGGTAPGHTTDCVAIDLAIGINAESCLIATNVSHVYSSDPSLDSEATKIMQMSHEELRTIVGEATEHEAGGRSVVDPVGAMRARENNLNLDVVDGKDLVALESALSGLPFSGTSIRGE
tara:strand:+ start:6163 stop:6924 length:762 start_codon:yes stop_codon:yes gene_type:complete